MASQFQHKAAMFTLAATAILLAGCGHETRPRLAQAVAKVDGYEITVHEVNEILSRLPAQPSADPAALQARALDNVIDRRLLVAKALETKLDRNPDVMEALAAARDDTLAKFYMQGVLGKSADADAAGVKAFYEQHPQLFAHRKLYDMRYVAIAAGDMSDEVTQVIDASQSVDQVAGWLQARSIGFEKAASSRSTAELPEKLVEHLDQLAGKRLFVMRQPSRVVIASLTFTKDVPVSLDAASADIRRYLAGQQADAAVSAELKRLRATAKIEYLDPPTAPAAGTPVALNAGAAAAPGAHMAEGAAGLR